MAKTAFRFGFFLLLLVFLVGVVPSLNAATINVGCDVNELINAISSASNGDILELAAGCTYTLTVPSPLSDANRGLPSVHTTLTINGNGATIERSSDPATPQFGLIYVGTDGDLTLNDVTFQNGYAAYGAAISNAGILTVSNSTFSGNQAVLGGGGGIYASVATTAVMNSNFFSNAASAGGGIFSEHGGLTVTNSTFSGSSASNIGGGIVNITGTASVTDSTFSNNSAENNGGGIFNSTGTLTVNGSIFSSNSVSNNAGGVYNFDGSLTVNDSTFDGNFAGNGGGGILSFGVDSSLTLTNSTVSNNSAPAGGGITSERMTLTNCTVAGNQATLQIGGGINGSGSVSNCTITGNTAMRFGGGIAVVELTVTNSTISGNSAGICGGGVYIPERAITLGGSTIVAGNSAPDGPDFCGGGMINSLGSNIVGDTSGDNNFTPAPGDLFDAAASPLDLGALMDNGGPTETMALGANSVALGAGNCSTLAGVPPVATDQRGIARETSCDVGAYERVSIVPPPEGTSIPTGSAVTNLCADVAEISDGAITATGAVGNVQAYGQIGNTYCRLIVQESHFTTSPAEIGVQSVLDLGVVQAVDVFGQLPDGVPVVPFVSPLYVCLRGSGDVLFLSAAGVGRTPESLPSTTNGEYQCVSVPNSGTVVLVGSVSTFPQQPATSSALDNCQVTTINAPLKLRAEPNMDAATLAQLPYNLTLTATEHVPGWYRVIYLDGQGWVSADFVSISGACSD